MPQLFVASGATTFGRDYKQYPWTIGFQPSYQAEGWIYGKYLARTKPGAKVAVLFQNDAYGKDLLVGLKQGIARSTVKVVAAEPYEVTAPDVQSQIATAEGLGRERARALRDPALRDSGLRVREPARLAAADHQQRRLERLQHHGAGLRGRHEQGGRELDLDRLPQGSDRREVAQRRGDEALPDDHGPVCEGREREGRLPRLRHGGGVRDGQGAEGGGEEPDPRQR